MANTIDPHVARVLDQGDSEDEDALIASLEDSPAMDAFREQRIQQLHSEFTRAKTQKTQGFGTFTEIKEEKALMDLTTEIKYTVVHFFKDDFARCAIMDGHLSALSPFHLQTRFLKIDVENAPFLVTKLKVQVLPCVLSFINGVVVDRIVGFEGLGYTPDTFTTKDLEARLLASGVVMRRTAGDLDVVGGGRKREEEREEEDDDDDDDWD